MASARPGAALKTRENCLARTWVVRSDRNPGHGPPWARKGRHTLARSLTPLSSLSQRPDNELMLRVQAGDLDAFSELVARFQDMVHGLAISILRRPEDAEEATQDTFLKLFRARGQFDGSRAVEPWLLRIAGNACRDKLRRRRAASLPNGRAEDRDLFELPDARLQQGAVRQALDHTVRGELEQLSDKVRMPLELKYLRGLTNQQIADALGVSLSSVKVQLARGKDILASRLQGVREA
ncbi:MAG: RNA polymerase sigma factor [Planctomycetes bacterium]|nr:RNA polymerase sigma factor [Planctomycetota bacterium]